MGTFNGDGTWTSEVPGSDPEPIEPGQHPSRSTVDLIAAELPRHVDVYLYAMNDDGERVDTGGLTCRCGEWEAGPRFERYASYRPWEAYHRHVAESILRTITAAPIDPDTIVAARVAVHQALAPEWGTVITALNTDQDAYEQLLADIATAVLRSATTPTTRR